MSPSAEAQSPTAGRPFARIVQCGTAARTAHGSFATAGERRWRRVVLSASSWGRCGVSSMEAIHEAAPPLPDDGLSIDPEVIYGLDARLRAEQAIFSRTGGLHAAGLFTLDGQPVAVREDIGRHNAVDKVIGL